MQGSHVVGLSVSAAMVLLVVFFGVLFSLRWMGASRMLGAILAPLCAGAAWFTTIDVGHRRGWALSDEAQFHHLYVLGVIGLPVVGLVLAVSAWRRPKRSADRRASAVAAAVFLVPAVAGIWATHIEPNWLRVDRSTVAVRAASTPVDEPIRIGVIADIQTDNFGEYEYETLRALMAEAPDVIVVAGDTTQVPPSAFSQIRSEEIKALSMLDAPHGVFVIEGNTDPTGGVVADVSAAAGLTPLVDEIVEVTVRGQTIRIGGLGWPNNQRAEARVFVDHFAETASPGTIDVLLAHSPDAILNVADASTIDLVVSGHTHGGQIALPLMGPMWNVTELPDDVAGGGLHDVRGAQMYISTGVGVNRGESPKIRFGVRPSIGVLTVVPAR